MSERKVKGLLGTKLGMTQLWDENNRVVPVTVVAAGPCVVTQVRTTDADQYTLGQELGADVFEAAEILDVTGVSKGKGTAGVMKRHGFGGLRATHGVHRKHRSPGSIGGCATPGRVFKGLRMAGRMGVERQTVQNLAVHSVDAERGLILIKGAIPGAKGGLVVLRSASKKEVKA
jgi:large subunit ribosomal protein L3